MEETRKLWTIRCGRHLYDPNDRVLTHVIATEEEVYVIGAAIARYERATREQMVACIAYNVKDDCEVVICDCM